MTRALTGKQQKFAELVAKGAAAADAYRRAYDTRKMNPASVQKEATRLMHHPMIAPLLNQITAAAVLRTQQTVTLNLESTLFELGRLAHADVRQMFDPRGKLKPIHEMDPDTAATISGFDVVEYFEQGKDGKGPVGLVKKVRLHSKVQALEQLMRHFGGFKEDNEQKRDLLDNVSRELLKRVIERLEGNGRSVIPGLPAGRGKDKPAPSGQERARS